MRRVLCVLALVIPVLAASAPAHATRTCPAGPSGFVDYEIFGELGDPAPTAEGQEPLWDIAVEGFTEEGFGSVQEVVDAFGFGTVDNLYAFVLSGWLRVDKNGDRIVCVQEFPDHDQGTPAYIFNFIDDSANVPG